MYRSIVPHLLPCTNVQMHHICTMYRSVTTSEILCIIMVATFQKRILLKLKTVLKRISEIISVLEQLLIKCVKTL